MPALIDESTQYVDVNGSPLNAGKIYIGAQGLDPVVNSVTIYSDRELTVVLANPLALDSLGRPSSKIWVSGRYSLRVEDVDGVQQLEELDNGEEPSTGISSLTNVLGTNTITAEANPTISAYVDLQLYTFTVLNANTGSVTLNIDGNGAITIKKNHDVDLIANDFEANQVVIVSYNATDVTFELVNQSVEGFVKGADIASASPLVIGTDGQYFDVTGTTGFSVMTVATDRLFILQFDGILTMTHGASIVLPANGDNITTAAGDEAICFSTAANTVRVVSYTRADGKAVKPSVPQVVSTQTGAVATGTTQIPNDDTIPQIGEGTSFFSRAITPKNTANTLIIDVVAMMSHSSATQLIQGALFQDSTAGALKAVSQFAAGAAQLVILTFRHEMAAGTTSSTTFQFRSGAGGAGTLTFNGTGGGRKYGGVLASSIIITEIEA